jgi:hypothetical protein
MRKENIYIFLTIDLEAYFKFNRLEFFLTNECMSEFTHMHNYYRLLADWCEEGRVFMARDRMMYPTINLKASYVYANKLVNKLYGLVRVE